jgi:hypothetical protein
MRHDARQNDVNAGIVPAQQQEKQMSLMEDEVVRLAKLCTDGDEDEAKLKRGLNRLNEQETYAALRTALEMLHTCFAIARRPGPDAGEEIVRIFEIEQQDDADDQAAA